MDNENCKICNRWLPDTQRGHYGGLCPRCYQELAEEDIQ